MKRIIFLFLLFLVFATSKGQTILNGSFENNTATGDQINISNPTFNLKMPYCNGFGTYGDLDIISSATYCGLAQDGNWYIAFTGSGTDACALQLSQPLIAGNSYTLTFYDRSCPQYGPPYPIQIGVSTVNNAFGTTILTGTITPTMGVWTKRTVNFIAPNNGQYITIQMNGGGLGNWSQVDNFCLGACGGTAPIADFQSSDTAFCNEGGQCIDFFDLSTGSPTGWKWSFPGATPDTSTMQNPTGICYYVPGSYNVKLVVQNGVGSDSMFVTPLIIFATGASKPVFTASNDTIYCSHAVSYQWYFNGSPIPGATDSFYFAPQFGTYNAYITDENGCSRLGDGFFYVGISNHPGDYEFAVSPNPTTGLVTVYGMGLSIGNSIRLYNVLGEKVYSSKIGVVSDHRTEFDISFLSKGIYILEVDSGNNSSRIRIMKE